MFSLRCRAISESKSRGNVLNPDDYVKSHGADTLRVYEMFMGPLEAALPWSDANMEGSRRWLDRVYRLFVEESKLSEQNSHELDRVYHQTVKKVSSDIETLNLNTAISQMMIFVNECYKASSIYKEYALGFIKLVSAFAPHLGEEIWEHISGKQGITYEPWPTYDEAMLVLSVVEMVVQINGKLKGKFTIKVDESDDVVLSIAKAIPSVVEALEGKSIVKEIVVKNKIVNLVIR